MHITLLGTGSPAPVTERAGTAIVLESGDERLLVDCGPGCVHRMIEHGVDPGSIDHLLFSHHHIDHNADFYHFIITKCTRGATPIALHGPSPGTDTLVHSLADVYEADIRYRERVQGRSTGLFDLDVDTVTDGWTLDTDRFRIRALAVDHSIETYAYRFTETASGDSVVFSGDTAAIDALVAFAHDADVLIQDCCLAPDAADPPNPAEYIWESYLGELPERLREGLADVHCGPDECGTIAREASVGHLVLTHLLPYRDEEAMRERAEKPFDGTVTVGRDGLAFDV